MNGELIVAGIATGGLYATSAFTLALTYRASRVLNLAQGAVALLAATAVAELSSVPVVLAALIAMAGCAVLGLVLEVSTRNPDPLARLTTVTGWLLALSALAGFEALADATPRFPLGTSTVSVAGVALGWDQVVLVVLAVALPVGLQQALRRTRAGALVIAVADAPESSHALAIDVVAISRVVWVGSMVLVGLVGILAAPTLGLEAVTSLKLLAGGLLAALVGGFDRLGRPVIAGFALGVLTALLGDQLAPAFVDALLVAGVIAALTVQRGALGAAREARV